MRSCRGLLEGRHEQRKSSAGGRAVVLIDSDRLRVRSLRGRSPRTERSTGFGIFCRNRCPGGECRTQARATAQRCACLSHLGSAARRWEQAACGCPAAPREGLLAAAGGASLACAALGRRLAPTEHVVVVEERVRQPVPQATATAFGGFWIRVAALRWQVGSELVDEDRRAILCSAGRVRADVEMPDEAGRGERTDPGKDLQRRDFARTGKRMTALGYREDSNSENV